MSYPKYLEYKNSGLEWLGKIPAHWEIRKLKYIAKISYGVGDELDKSLISGIPLISLPNVGMDGTLDLTELGWANLLLPKDEKLLLRKGDLLFNWRNGSSEHLGKTAYFDKDDIFTHVGFLLRIRFDLTKFQPKFFQNYINALRTTGFFLYARAMVNNTFNQTELSNLQAAFPPFEEQQTIISYIETETKKLDALIAIKKRLLVLLAEKRRALITQAVTRGLNADAPMRDSGVEWLGEVPRHWKVVQLKFLCISLQTGPFGSQLHADEYIENGVPVINPVHLNNGKILPDLSISIDIETANRLSIHKLLPEDVVFARRGELGRCGVVTDTEKGWICGTGSLRARLKNKFLISIYLFLYVTNTGASDSLSLESVGSTMDNLNTETLGELPVLCPPIEEQKAIVTYIETETKKLDLLKAATERTISLLKERRASLIAAAVTGQIAVGEQV